MRRDCSFVQRGSRPKWRLLSNRGPDPAVPIADFGRNEDIRNDFVGEAIDPASIAALRQGFAPILHRLREMPFRSAHEDRAEMTVLRLAYSRDTAIEARFDPELRNIVEYPLLGRAPAMRQRLELLADLDLLRRQHFTRTHLCRRCDSARLHATEVCAACDSADLVEEPIVHHYRCGWQEPELRFAGDPARMPEMPSGTSSLRRRLRQAGYGCRLPLLRQSECRTSRSFHVSRLCHGDADQRGEDRRLVPI